ncbi:serine O-acetyltransferase [Candidatus Ventrimonas sp. KK005]
MCQIPEYNSLTKLCIPTMFSVLKDFFISEDILSMNASLNLSEGQLVDFAYDVLLEDLNYDIINLADNDPAAGTTGNRMKYVWDSYKGLKAVMYYRIANHLLDFDHNCLMTQSSLTTEEDVEMMKDYMRLQARRISEKAAMETTIEINPVAQIGKGFVIDHGIGTKVAPGESKFSTVIGETCVIGENCTLLNSVLLGAAVINKASSGKEGVAKGKRHPTLGNHVTVCAGVRILGNIKIGDDVTIGPCCVITTDVPAGYNVTIVNQLQYSRPDPGHESGRCEPKPSIHGLTLDGDVLKLLGSNLEGCTLSVVIFDGDQETEVKGLTIKTFETLNNVISFVVAVEGMLKSAQFSLRIATLTYEYILITPQALNLYIRREAKL